MDRVDQVLAVSNQDDRTAVRPVAGTGGLENRGQRLGAARTSGRVEQLGAVEQARDLGVLASCGRERHAELAGQLDDPSLCERRKD